MLLIWSVSYIFTGLATLSLLDTNELIFLDWVNKAPFPFLKTIVILFWPILAIFMVKYRYDEWKWKQKQKTKV